MWRLCNNFVNSRTRDQSTRTVPHPQQGLRAIPASALRKPQAKLSAQPMPLRAAKRRESRFPEVKRQRWKRARLKQREMVLSLTVR